MADPTRDFPDTEIESCLTSYGDWCGWLGDFQDTARQALEWKAGQGDELPLDLEPLRDALAMFGQAPIEEAVQRVQGLEKAFAEIAEIMGGGKATGSLPGFKAVAIWEIVESCVRFSGGCGTVEDDEEVATDV